MKIETISFFSVKVGTKTETYPCTPEGVPIANVDAKGTAWFNKVCTVGKSKHAFHLQGEGDPEFLFRDEKELVSALKQAHEEQVSLEDLFTRDAEQDGSWQSAVDAIYRQYGRLNADGSIPANVGRAALVAAMTVWLQHDGSPAQLRALADGGYTSTGWCEWNKARKASGGSGGSSEGSLEQALDLLKSL